MKSPIVLLRAILDDVKRLQPCVKGLDRDFLTIQHRFEHEGFSFLSVALPSLSDAIDFGIETGRFICPTSFSRVKSGALPKLFQGLLIEVFDNSGFLKPSASVEAILTLRQVCRMFKKTNVSSSRQDFLEYKAEQKFIDDDASLKGISFPERESRILSIVSRLLVSGVSHDHGFRNGPGAVYEPIKGNEKWKRIYYSLPHTPDCFHDSFDMLDIFQHNDSLDGRSALSSSHKARLIFVPKTAIAVRSITVEPALLQFLQQGLNAGLRDHLRSNRIAQQCLSLTDQSKNQVLALEGSRSNNIATIDLSSASDLLSLKLVKLVFDSERQFLLQLESSRSSIISLPSGKELIVEKYAGMGNATTFPVQSISFAAICIAAIHDSLGIMPTYSTCMRVARSVQVYGDDIIVPSEHYHTVRRWLSEFGLRVNEDKTFSQGKFRESCGTDAFDGVDITPTYLRFDPSSSSKDPGVLSSLISTSNQLWLKGWYLASNAIKDHIERLLKRRLPLVNPDSGLLGWHDRYGSTHAHDWDANHHRLVVKSLGVTPVKRKDTLGDQPALFKFFLTSLLERRNGHLERSAIRYKTRIAQRWAPAIAGYAV